jgi:hypothetical protein
MVARLSLLQLARLIKSRPLAALTHSAQLKRQGVIQFSGRGSLDRSIVFA